MAEIVRVTSVLDNALQSTEYLVGDKCTYADLAFITWANVAKGLLVQLGQIERIEKYQNYKSWMARLESREVVKSVNERIAAGRSAHGLP